MKKSKFEMVEVVQFWLKYASSEISISVTAVKNKGIIKEFNIKLKVKLWLN